MRLSSVIVSAVILGLAQPAWAADEAKHAVKSGSHFGVEVVKDVPYYAGADADAVKHKLDLYLPKGHKDFPVLFFVHGGAWRSGLAKDYAFPAEMFVAAGAHYVVPDFAWVQDAGGSLAPISDQIRRALAWVARNAASFGGDASRIYVSGHSSGGHQAAVLATTDWKRDFGLPPEVVKGYVLISGIYELYPVSLSARASYVKFDERTLAELSAMRHLERIGAPVALVYGTLETPEFQRQSREFAQALRKAGMPVQLIVADGYNHFEVMETLGHPFEFAGRAALEQMKLKTPA